MKGILCSRLAKMASLALLTFASAIATPANATVIVDTFIPTDRSNGNLALVWQTGVVNLRQDLGLGFSIASTFDVTNFLVAINGTGSFIVGIEGSTTTSYGVVPDGSFLYRTTVTNPSLNLAVSGLDWVLSPGTYYLVAQVEALNAGSGFWGYGVPGASSSAISANQSPWVYAPTLAGRINGIAVDAPPPAVPEPPSIALLALGSIALVWRRAKRRSGASIG